MNRKEILRYAAVGVIAAIATTLVLGSGFLTLLLNKPEIFTPLIQSFGIDSNVSLNSSASSDSSESKIIAVVKNSNPAVVAITVSKNIPVYERYYEDSPGSFDDLFNRFFFQVPQIRQNGTELQEVGGGSGFLVSEDGYIVTNRHVVDDVNAEYAVFTNDGEKYTAEVVARDTVLDIAIIKIEGEGFAHLAFGDSDQLEVGQSVIAIGNALAEFRNTVSVGVVSGLSRSIVASDLQGGIEALDQLIQTDAAINGGNSGGPLLDLAGEVIGVNVAIVSGAQNVGFALSSNSVKNIVESVKQTGKITRPYIGVRYIPVTPELQERNNLEVDHGVLVQRGATQNDLAVIPGSPADEAGILENDIILEVDGVKLDENHSLSSLIGSRRVGDRVTLKILTKGVEKTVTLELAPME